MSTQLEDERFSGWPIWAIIALAMYLVIIAGAAWHLGEVMRWIDRLF